MLCPFESNYRECQIYLRKNPRTVINKYVVGELSSKAYIKAMTPSNLISAFQKAGIYPFNKDAVTSFQLAPSTIYPSSEKELILLGFNDTSTLEGHFVSSPREREKRDRRESRGDEREGQGRKRNRNESEETEEIKTFPLYPYPLQG